ncbi:MAG: lycopene cyclase family protein [Mobilicoccus sp.]|nr:lycopene cyclase family protein [Mobilicoccus sp.]
MTSRAMVWDVAIVGLGPAGRALAHHCSVLGLSVLAVDPEPDRVWRPTYGVWADEIDDMFPRSVQRSRTAGPALAAPTPHTLLRTYVVLDNAALQAHLHLDDVDVRSERLDDVGVQALRRSARVVVDARGARPGTPQGALDLDGLNGAAAQTAYGIVLLDDTAAPALRGEPALLMDWSLDWAEDPQAVPANAVPTFLYAIPLGDGTTLLEETVLAAAPPVAHAELRARLHRRLQRRGVDAAALAQPLATEEVSIPMRGRDRRQPRGVLAVGTAGGGGNIVTGYSVAHSLARSAVLAGHLAGGRTPGHLREASPAAEILRSAGLRALLRLDVEGTLALFDAFGRVPARSQRAFLDRGSAALPLLESMTRMWLAMPGNQMPELVRATLGLRTSPGTHGAP